MRCKKRHVIIENQSKFLIKELDEKLLSAWLQCLEDCELLDIPKGELSVCFMDNKTLANLHYKYCQDSSNTDIITFKGDPNMEFAGELCISLEMVKEQASVRNLKLLEEVRLYFIHGCLHLSGLDDTTDQKTEKMRLAEQKCIEHLHKHGL